METTKGTKTMHKGSIHSKSAAGRVYRILRQRRRMVDSWTLSQLAMVTAVSTRISEVRAQIPETVDGQQRFYYLLERAL